MRDFLNLPGIRTTHVVEDVETIIVEAETAEPRFTQCCLFPDLVLNGNRQNRRMINDTPHSGKAVMIRLRIRRAKCRHCGKKAIYENPPHIRTKRHMTDRLWRFIAREGIQPGQTHSAVGRHIHVSEGTARSVVHEFIDQRIGDINRATPRVLGIGEKKLIRQFRAVVGNIEERTILNLLPDRDEALRRYLDELPDKDRIEVVCIDQFDGYRTMAKKLLPGRAIVCDKFYVVRKANQALDRIRAGVAANLREEDKRAGARLRLSRKLFWARADDLDVDARRAITEWGLRFPILSKAYWTKERFFEMYELCHTPGEAEVYYRRWRSTLDPDVAHHFINLANIAKRWLPHVFAYFDHPYTTAYVEAVNRGLDDMQRAGRGYSFEVIRGKLMLSEKLEKKTFRDRHPEAMARWESGLPPPSESNSFGVDIGLLSDALNARSESFRLVDGKYVLVRSDYGLSTILPDLGEAV